MGRDGRTGEGRIPRDGRALLIALGVGVIVRLLLLRLPRLWYDEATSGLLGLSVLGGELPVYFFGQPFMGALDGYLAAPLFWLLGVSARTLKLVPVLLALATLGLTVRLAHDAFGPRAALFTAVLLAVPPDFLLFWSHEARNHYPLTLLLGTLALLLALRAPAARGGPGDRPVRPAGRDPRPRLLDQLPLPRLFPGGRAPAAAPGDPPARPPRPRGAARVRDRQPAALALRRAARDGDAAGRPVRWDSRPS